MSVSANQSRLIELLKISGVAALYFASAAVFLIYIAPNGVVSAVWPPSGLALAAVLIGGRRYAISVLLGAFLANGFVNHTWLLAGPIALGNTLEALLGAWLLTRTGKFDQSFNSPRDYLRMIFWAGFVACSVAAVNGSSLLLMSGYTEDEVIRRGGLAHAIGDAISPGHVSPLGHDGDLRGVAHQPEIASRACHRLAQRRAGARDVLEDVTVRRIDVRAL